MLKEFADTAAARAADHTMLFNQDGYWLRSPDPSRVGLHARAPGSDPEADFPQAWQAFWDASNGQMESADGL
jgi:hypothetical protein